MLNFITYNWYRITLLGLMSIILLSCKQEVYVGEPELLPPANCVLSVNSYPTDLKIYFGSRNSGYLTPDRINWLGEGRTQVTLKKDWFRDSTFYVDLKDKETTYVYVDHRLNPKQYGKISFNSIPANSNVYLDGKLIGRTPCQTEHLWPGYYHVKFEQDLYRSDSSHVLVEANQVTNTYTTMEDTSKWVSYLTTNSPSPTNIYYDITTDQNNVKWMASDNAVVSFDGKNWMSYDASNSILPTGPVFKVVVDKQNNKWIASPGGLFKFDGTMWNNFNNYLPTSTVLIIACDEKGILWIGTNEGLVKYDGTNWTTYTTHNSGLYGDRISYVSTSLDGKVWFASYFIGMFDGTNWYKWTLDDMQIDPDIGMFLQDLKVDRDENVWVAHSANPKLNIRGGFTKYDGTKWSEVQMAVVPTSTIQSINVDKDNYKWIGTSGGLAKFLQPDFATVLYHLSLWVRVENVRGVTIDNNDDLWIATFGGGIAKIKKGNF